MEDGGPYEGSWRVERVSGVLPPWGLSKRISGARGVTCIANMPVLAFDVSAPDGCRARFVYRSVPLVDRVAALGADTWVGEGFFMRVRFCRFRLVRQR